MPGDVLRMEPSLSPRSNTGSDLPAHKEDQSTPLPLGIGTNSSSSSTPATGHSPAPTPGSSTPLTSPAEAQLTVVNAPLPYPDITIPGSSVGALDSLYTLDDANDDANDEVYDASVFDTPFDFSTGLFTIPSKAAGSSTDLLSAGTPTPTVPEGSSAEAVALVQFDPLGLSQMSQAAVMPAPATATPAPATATPAPAITTSIHAATMPTSVSLSVAQPIAKPTPTSLNVEQAAALVHLQPFLASLSQAGATLPATSTPIAGSLNAAQVQATEALLLLARLSQAGVPSSTKTAPLIAATAVQSTITAPTSGSAIPTASSTPAEEDSVPSTTSGRPTRTRRPPKRRDTSPTAVSAAPPAAKRAKVDKRAPAKRGRAGGRPACR
ncbi:hypothetical protein TRAPUB_464 [Trametes pubescens]|uniref:Uncharacterized protein n=1 Tax=Trametes pubescens TaxID=154538 RepID=A0A1M2VLZ2_TRAPU|nr:hypothetical protein TRAPUB_464 [Trametes pubescens]